MSLQLPPFDNVTGALLDIFTKAQLEACPGSDIAKTLPPSLLPFPLRRECYALSGLIAGMISLVLSSCLIDVVAGCKRQQMFVPPKQLLWILAHAGMPWEMCKCSQKLEIVAGCAITFCSATGGGWGIRARSKPKII